MRLETPAEVRRKAYRLTTTVMMFGRSICLADAIGHYATLAPNNHGGVTMKFLQHIHGGCVYTIQTRRQ